MSDTPVATKTKSELQTEITALQKQYTDLSKALKAIQAQEIANRNKEKFKDYTCKVWFNIMPGVEPMAIEEEDYQDMSVGRMGLPLVKFEKEGRQHIYIMLKSEAELPRLTLLMSRVNAVRDLLDEKQQLKPSEAAALHATILGETDAATEEQQ